MKQIAKQLSAVLGAALVALVLAVPVSAQTSGSGGGSAPAAYGNSGSTAAGPGTGATLRYNNSVGGNGGSAAIWGLVGLLGLFGLARGGRGRTNRKETLPRSGSMAGRTPTITDADVPSSTAPRPPR